MAHIPHLLAPGSWEADTVELDRAAIHHLRTVLRRGPGDPVSYTDGVGTLGEGVLTGAGIRRGPERRIPAPDGPVIAVAPPASKDRARILVEKLAELGVRRLLWIRTRHGEGRPPPVEKVTSWSRAALEQSRGAWLMDVSGPFSIADLPPGTVFADASGGEKELTGVSCIAIGPEGGWAPGEIPDEAAIVRLANTVLRVETAAIVAAVRAT